MNVWTPISTMTSRMGSRSRPRVKPMANSSVLMLIPRPIAASPRVRCSIPSRASSPSSLPGRSIHAPSAIRITMAM